MTSRIIVEDNTTEAGKRVYDAMDDPTRICDRCTHFMTCTIHRGVNRQIQYDFPNMKPEALPFSVTEVAKICRYYRRSNVGEEV